jgi:ribosomal protein S18 acetylase RimI-like enzyme
MRIERVATAAEVERGAALFDGPAQVEATGRFLGSPDHHLFFAYDDEDRPIGMVSGVETTHPDKGTELFLYELGVEPDARGRGVATELIGSLVEFARRRGCYAMWVAVDPDNDPALATYRRAGAHDEAQCVVFSWDLAAGS